jgi:mRNA interferase RelE/StbE
VSDDSSWRVIVTPRSEKDLRVVPARDRDRIRAAIQALADRQASRNVKKLRGMENEWRQRVGDWRIRFELDDSTRTVYILRVLPRGRAYRD